MSASISLKEFRLWLPVGIIPILNGIIRLLTFGAPMLSERFSQKIRGTAA